MRVVSFVILFTACGGILAACGGASETNLFDDVPQSSPTSAGQGGTSGVGTSGAMTSSGVSGSSGGSGGTSGNASSGGTSGNASSTSGVIVPPAKDAGPPGPRKCLTNDPNGCFPGEYCQTASCGATGICTARANAAQDFNPVCGCDHITYWNPAIASNHGANVAAAGACTAGISCTRNPGCAGDAVCNLEQAVCSVGEVKGTCWMLPKSCEATNSPKVRRCSSVQCTSLCLAVADERQFVAGTGCP